MQYLRIHMQLKNLRIKIKYLEKGRVNLATSRTPRYNKNEERVQYFFPTAEIFFSISQHIKVQRSKQSDIYNKFFNEVQHKNPCATNSSPVVCTQTQFPLQQIYNLTAIKQEYQFLPLEREVLAPASRPTKEDASADWRRSYRSCGGRARSRAAECQERQTATKYRRSAR